MNAYPLNSITLNQAKKMQFKLVDIVTRYFTGNDMVSMGDLGVISGLNKPTTTYKAEKVIADFFGQESAVLVRGAGTGAIRYGLMSILRHGQNLLVHDAPVYNTTMVTLESMGINLIRANFNESDEIIEVIKNNKIDGALIQYTRQKIDDKYDIGDVISIIRKYGPEIPIITDDNYAVMKVEKIGVQYGADISCFSCFKLLGPEGVGCITGKACFIDRIVKYNYSGGCQVQGFEAMEVLRGLIYAPVSLAIQAEVNDELVARLNSDEVPGVKSAFLANAQSKVLLVEFEDSIANKVLKEAERLGAAPNPVGAESKYEIVPMFYRVSGTFRASDSTLEDRMIRINPMRCGADTVIRILREAILKVI